MYSILSKLVLCISLFTICVSCSDNFEPIPFFGNLDLPTEYSYELMINCYCTQNYVGPHKLHIKGDEIVNYEIELDGGAVFNDVTDIKLFTIDALAKRVDEILARDPFTQKVEVHPDYNFPVSVYFDIDQRIADEEWGYEVTNFKVIED